MADSQEQGTATVKKKSLMVRLFPVLFIVAALIAFFALDLQRYFSIDALRENREVLLSWRDSNFWLAVIIFTGVYAATSAISFPGASILTIFGGFLFGLWAGTASVVIGATAGATVLFLVAKNFAGDLLKDKAGGFVKKMEAGFREDELSYMFLLRLVPAFPFWGVNIASGLIGVSTRNYIIGTFFGIIPGTFVYVSIGNGVGAAFDAGKDVQLSGVLTQPAILLPIVGLVVLALIPIIYKKFLRKKSNA